MRDEAVIELPRRQYDTALPGLVSGKLPDFDLAYSTVQAFFESLPWGRSHDAGGPLEPMQIKQVRQAPQSSQSVFAAPLNTSLSTVRK